MDRLGERCEEMRWGPAAPIRGRRGSVWCAVGAGAGAGAGAAVVLAYYSTAMAWWHLSFTTISIRLGVIHRTSRHLLHPASDIRLLQLNSTKQVIA